jgi:hypothetical protein
VLLTSLALAAGVTFASSSAQAQFQVSQPVVVKSPKPSTKLLKYKGTVISANSASITLRNPENPRLIQSFSFSPQVRDQMVKILTRGGYQYGDAVTVQHAAGSDVAQRMHGKPSKPRHF